MKVREQNVVAVGQTEQLYSKQRSPSQIEAKPGLVFQKTVQFGLPAFVRESAQIRDCDLQGSRGLDALRRPIVGVGECGAKRFVALDYGGQRPLQRPAIQRSREPHAERPDV